MLKKMNLRTKLLGGFLMVASLCAFVGVYSIVQLRQSGTAYRGVLTESTTNLGSVNALNISFMKLRHDGCEPSPSTVRKLAPRSGRTYG
jgi:hypothetical protein